MIDVYNDGKPQELKYIIRTIPTRLTMRGFIYTDYMAEFPAFYAGNGRLGDKPGSSGADDSEAGPDQTLDAFLGLFEGANTGKMLVRTLV